jgi:hypothetical protein
MNKLRIMFIIISISSLIAGSFVSPEKKINEEVYLHEVAPDVNFSKKKSVPPHYESKSGIVAFNTYDIVPSIRGYAGPIKLLLALNKKGEISGLKILDHRETKNYVHYMLTPEYLRQFLGKNINDPFEIDNDIDGISRATESVEALAKTIRESSRKVASQVYGLEVKGVEGGKGFETGWIFYLLLFFIAFILYYLTRKSKEFLRIRDISLILGLIIIGIYLATPFSILHIFNLVLTRFSSSILVYAIIISILMSIVFAGRFYCGWLCPFGALAEFISRLPFHKWKISVEIDNRWRNLKYFLLGIITIAVLTGRHLEYGNYEVYVTLFSFHGSVLAWLLVILMLIINIKVERFWCRYLCPVAALMGLCTRKDSGYISKQDCPMGNKPNPLISECIRCNRCYIRT